MKKEIIINGEKVSVQGIKLEQIKAYMAEKATPEEKHAIAKIACDESLTGWNKYRAIKEWFVKTYNLESKKNKCADLFEEWQ